MLNRYVSFAACLCFVASTVAVGQSNQGTGYLFEVPGATSAGSHFQGFIYNANPLNPVIDASGPSGTSQIIAKPDGTKFYVLGNGTGGLESVDPSFTTFRAINGITGSACVASITPDGKYLLVGAAPTCHSGTSSLYILDTSSDSVLSNTVSVTGSILGFAISPDAQTAWMLTNSAFGSAVSAFSLSTRARTGLLNLPFGGATAIVLAPTGLLYVSAVNRLYEINTAAPDSFSCDNTFNENPPLCITPTGQISLVATPGPLRLTPSGQIGYMVNTDTGTGGQSLIRINLQSRNVATWPAFNSGVTPPVFTDVYIAGESLVYAVSAADTTIWDVTPSPLSAAPSTTLAGAITVNSVLSAALSNELPSARFLYVLTANGSQTNLQRIDLSTFTVSVQSLALLGPGVLQYALVPPETGAAGFLQFNSNQANLKAGATSLPMIALVLDGTGRPVYNLPVTYTESDANGGLVIHGATQTTNKDGYVAATATLPATPGTYQVTMTAGTATTTFTLTIPGVNIPGGPNNTNQVTIVSGNGMFLQAFSGSPLYSPLTVKVTDPNGNPVANEEVTFTVVSGPGSVDNGVTTTDMNGLASTDFFGQNPQEGYAFQASDVNASAPEGSVDFTETTFVLNMDGTGIPQVSVTPPQGSIVTVGEGDVVTNGITGAIFTSMSPTQPVPNVGMRLGGADYTNLTQSPASCQDSTLSDQLGIAHCNVVAACGLALNSLIGLNVIVGEYRIFGMFLKVVPGTTQTLNIKNGNNQSGQAGQTLSLPLAALVTDNCGTPISKVNVSWQVTQGSATLKNTITQSDLGGNVSTQVVLGQSPGVVKVTVSIGNTAQAVFTLTNNVVVAGISLVSGGGQSVFANQAFPQPLVFQVVDINGKPVPSIQVNFSVAAGNVSVNPTSGTTDVNGRVTTSVQAGSFPGTATIVASYNTFTVSATLTVKTQGPLVTATSFTNAATANSPSAQVGLVPCGLATVTGTGLATTIQGVKLGNPLGIGPSPYTLAGVSMTINSVNVPLLSVSNSNGVEQVNFQTPCETSPGTATVVVQVNGASTIVGGVPVLAVQPGLFNFAGPNNKPYGFVIRALDGSYVTPSNPAHRGELYYLVVTGMGQASPPIITNAAGTGNQVPLGTVVVGVNNAGVPTSLSEYASGQIGVYVIGFTIPTNAPTGTDQPLAVEVVPSGGQPIFGNPVYLPGVI